MSGGKTRRSRALPLSPPPPRALAQGRSEERGRSMTDRQRPPLVMRPHFRPTPEDASPSCSRAVAMATPAAVDVAPPSRKASGKRTEKRRFSSPLAISPAKRPPPSPELDPLEMILREMRAISSRVGLLETGQRQAATGDTSSLGMLLPRADAHGTAVTAADESLDYQAGSSLSPSPSREAVCSQSESPSAAWEEEADQVELQLHPSESSDGSLYSPTDEGARAEASDSGLVERESGLLADIRMAAYDAGLTAPAVAERPQLGQGVWAGVPLHKGDPPFPVAEGYVSMLRRSWDTVVPSERWNPGCSVLRRLRYDPAAGLEAMPPVEREVTELTAPPSKVEDDPSLPDKDGRAADRLTVRSFDAAMRAARAGNLLAIALASARHQAEGADPRLARSLTTALTLQSQVVRDLGECLAGLVRSRRHLWLGASSFPLAIRDRLVSLPVEPGRVFHSSSRAVLEGVGEARKARRKITEGLKPTKPKAPPRPKASRGSVPAMVSPLAQLDRPQKPGWAPPGRPFRGRKAARGRPSKGRGGKTGS